MSEAPEEGGEPITVYTQRQHSRHSGGIVGHDLSRRNAELTRVRLRGAGGTISFRLQEAAGGDLARLDQQSEVLDRAPRHVEREELGVQAAQPFALPDQSPLIPLSFQLDELRKQRAALAAGVSPVLPCDSARSTPSP